jgi:hypothetical protein
MADQFSVKTVVSGVKEAVSALDVMDTRTEAATLVALKKSQTAAKSSIKSLMNRAPRWNRRGPMSIGGREIAPAWDNGRRPVHNPRSGPAGKATGTLRGAVGGVRRPKRIISGAYQGGVGVGGIQSVTNLYRKQANAKYPFMQPGVDKAQPKIAVIYREEWAKAVKM